MKDYIEEYIEHIERKNESVFRYGAVAGGDETMNLTDTPRVISIQGRPHRHVIFKDRISP